MLRFLPFSMLLLLANQKPVASPYFSGCIEYENEYQNAAGETMYYAAKPKSWLYVQGNNFKLYNRKKALQELYVGATDKLYHFERGKAVLVADSARHAPARAPTKFLATTATVLGYPCHTLQQVRGGLSTLIFYSDSVRVRLADFSQSRSSGWYELLQATHGALPLRTIIVDAAHGVTVTSEAISVRPMALLASDFTPTAPAR